MPPKSRKSGPPKHQNAFAWVPHSMDKHNALAKTMEKLDLRGGVCDKCFEVIDWKKKYGKYKPRRQPGKCLGCDEKTVSQAYHQLCPPCSSSRRVCAKCMLAPPAPPGPEELEARAALAQADVEAQLRMLSERQRRGANRALAVGAVPASLTARVNQLRAASDAANGTPAPGTATCGMGAPVGGASPPPPVPPAASDAHGGSGAVDPGRAETAANVDVVLGRAEALGLLSEAGVDRLTDAIATGARTEGEVEAEWRSKIAAATAPG